MPFQNASCSGRSTLSRWVRWPDTVPIAPGLPWLRSATEDTVLPPSAALAIERSSSRVVVPQSYRIAPTSSRAASRSRAGLSIRLLMMRSRLHARASGTTGVTPAGPATSMRPPPAPRDAISVRRTSSFIRASAAAAATSACSPSFASSSLFAMAATSADTDAISERRAASTSEGAAPRGEGMALCGRTGGTSDSSPARMDSAARMSAAASDDTSSRTAEMSSPCAAAARPADSRPADTFSTAIPRSPACACRASTSLRTASTASPLTPASRDSTAAMEA
mmetsp:Transcript_36995/g.116369  ORF Transcript_36995/g.116369 Transcript_36995/m.116369 type:complete len:280 (-) Transcript_36995:351-1190(-)